MPRQPKTNTTGMTAAKEVAQAIWKATQSGDTMVAWDLESCLLGGLYRIKIKKEDEKYKSLVDKIYIHITKGLEEHLTEDDKKIYEAIASRALKGPFTSNHIAPEATILIRQIASCKKAEHEIETSILTFEKLRADQMLRLYNITDNQRITTGHAYDLGNTVPSYGVDYGVDLYNSREATSGNKNEENRAIKEEIKNDKTLTDAQIKTLNNFLTGNKSINVISATVAMNKVSYILHSLIHRKYIEKSPLPKTVLLLDNALSYEIDFTTFAPIFLALGVEIKYTAVKATTSLINGSAQKNSGDVDMEDIVKELYELQQAQKEGEESGTQPTNFADKLEAARVGIFTPEQKVLYTLGQNEEVTAEKMDLLLKPALLKMINSIASALIDTNTGNTEGISGIKNLAGMVGGNRVAKDHKTKFNTAMTNMLKKLHRLEVYIEMYQKLPDSNTALKKAMENLVTYLKEIQEKSNETTEEDILQKNRAIVDDHFNALKTLVNSVATEVTGSIEVARDLKKTATEEQMKDIEKEVEKAADERKQAAAERKKAADSKLVQQSAEVEPNSEGNMLNKATEQKAREVYEAIQSGETSCEWDLESCVFAGISSDTALCRGWESIQSKCSDLIDLIKRCVPTKDGTLPLNAIAAISKSYINPESAQLMQLIQTCKAEHKIETSICSVADISPDQATYICKTTGQTEVTKYTSKNSADAIETYKEDGTSSVKNCIEDFKTLKEKVKEDSELDAAAKKKINAYLATQQPFITSEGSLRKGDAILYTLLHRKYIAEKALPKTVFLFDNDPNYAALVNKNQDMYNALGVTVQCVLVEATTSRINQLKQGNTGEVSILGLTKELHRLNQEKKSEEEREEFVDKSDEILDEVLTEPQKILLEIQKLCEEKSKAKAEAKAPNPARGEESDSSSDEEEELEPVAPSEQEKDLVDRLIKSIAVEDAKKLQDVMQGFKQKYKAINGGDVIAINTEVRKCFVDAYGMSDIERFLDTLKDTGFVYKTLSEEQQKTVKTNTDTIKQSAKAINPLFASLGRAANNNNSEFAKHKQSMIAQLDTINDALVKIANSIAGVVKAPEVVEQPEESKIVAPPSGGFATIEGEQKSTVNNAEGANPERAQSTATPNQQDNAGDSESTGQDEDLKQTPVVTAPKFKRLNMGRKILLHLPLINIPLTFIAHKIEAKHPKTSADLKVCSYTFGCVATNSMVVIGVVSAVKFSFGDSIITPSIKKIAMLTVFIAIAVALTVLIVDAIYRQRTNKDKSAKDNFVDAASDLAYITIPPFGTAMTTIIDKCTTEQVESPSAEPGKQ